MSISAVVPARNAEATLGEAIRSLVATGRPDLEIVVVDDGSTDRTLEVGRALEEEFGCVRLLAHPGGAHLGVSASRNLGLRAGVGEWVCFLDADDLVLPHRFHRAAEVLEADPSIDGVYDTVRLDVENPGDPWHGRELFGITEAVPPEGVLDVLLGGTVWAVSGILFRREVLGRSGLFRPGMALAEDCNLWFRMAAIGAFVPGHLDAPVAIYRRHGGNTFRPGLARKVPMVAAMADALRWARRHPTRPGAADRMAQHLERYLTHGVALAREEGREDLALAMLRAAAGNGAPATLLRRSVLRQELGLLRDALTGRRSATDSPAL